MAESKSGMLSDIVFIRLTLILLLVVYHSFIIYRDHPAGYEDITCYSWIAKISYSFFLEAFVAISGYIYAYQILVRKNLCRSVNLY